MEPDSGVVSGEDDLPRQPSLEDPFTPAPARNPGNRWAYRAVWLAIAVVVVVAAVIAIWPAVR